LIDIVQNVPEEKRLLLQQLVAQLSGITEIAAIVLGGSYASGTHHPASDLDIGLYYFEHFQSLLSNRLLIVFQRMFPQL